MSLYFDSRAFKCSFPVPPRSGLSLLFRDTIIDCQAPLPDPRDPRSQRPDRSPNPNPIAQVSVPASLSVSRQMVHDFKFQVPVYIKIAQAKKLAALGKKVGLFNEKIKKKKFKAVNQKFSHQPLPAHAQYAQNANKAPMPSIFLNLVCQLFFN